MAPDATGELAPAIALALGASLAWDEVNPSFLNWAVEETDRLRATITPETTRETRFEIQNRIAAIAGTAHAYGQWLYTHAG